jgi:hypothetical protein
MLPVSVVRFESVRHEGGGWSCEDGKKPGRPLLAVVAEFHDRWGKGLLT